jgi:PKHD-type hydroxylase
MNKSGVVNYYYYYPGYFSDAACEKISNSVKTNNVAKVDGNQIPKDHVRKTQVGFTSENFIYDLICPVIQEANIKAGWNYDITWYEPAQIGKYADGGHYDWHNDSNGKTYKSQDPNFDGKLRKLSCSVILSDRAEYEGGNLQFAAECSPNNTEPEILENPSYNKKGSVIIFPSHVWHRVTPVTSGIRKSCVLWCLGPAFK